MLSAGAMVRRFQLFELGFLLVGQHLLDFLLPFQFCFLEYLLDVGFLRIGQVKLLESRGQMRHHVHLSGRRRWRGGIVVGPYRLQAQE